MIALNRNGYRSLIISVVVLFARVLDGIKITCSTDQCLGPVLNGPPMVTSKEMHLPPNHM